jgi:hypothetical protein
MAKQNIGDIIASIIVAIYVMPQLKQAFMQIFCSPQIVEINPNSCGLGFIVLYVIPAIPIIWFLLRIVIKLSDYFQ